MIHREYKRIVKGSNTAVLFIHGIVGTPYQFRELVPLVPDCFSIHNLLLPGHADTPEGFSRASMKQWESSTEHALLDLAKNHENIIVVGHSMGTLLSAQLAINHPDKVKCLFLQAMPLIPMPNYQALQHVYTLLYGSAETDTPHETEVRNAYSITPERDLTKYKGWYKRFIELFRKAHFIRTRLDEITVPCIAFQSRKDELVSNKSEEILREHDNIVTYALENSSHNIYSDEDKILMLSCFEAVMDRFLHPELYEVSNIPQEDELPNDIL